MEEMSENEMLKKLQDPAFVLELYRKSSDRMDYIIEELREVINDADEDYLVLTLELPADYMIALYSFMLTSKGLVTTEISKLEAEVERSTE